MRDYQKTKEEFLMIGDVKAKSPELSSPVDASGMDLMSPSRQEKWQDTSKIERSKIQNSKRSPIYLF